MANLVESYPPILEQLLEKNASLVTILIHKSNDGPLETQFACLRAIAVIMSFGSPETVRMVVSKGALTRLEEFLRGDYPNKAEIMLEVLRALERACNINEAKNFGGWNAVDDMLTCHTVDSDVAKLAESLLDRFGTGQDEEAEVGSENQFGSSMVVTVASKRRKLSNTTVLGLSNRFH